MRRPTGARAGSSGAAVALLLATLAAAAPACSDDPPTGELVVGITSDFRAGTDLGRIDYEVAAAGETLASGSIPDGSGKLFMPAELALQPVSTEDEVSIRIEGFAPNGQPLGVARQLRTSALAGQKLLVRMHLDSRCTAPIIGDPRSGPACDEANGFTCDRGKCVEERVAPTAWDPYKPGWDTVSSDPCKTTSPEPVLVVGEGQGDYLPTGDGDVAQVEAGPQGGHHIWIAVRAKGVRQSGSVTTVDGEVPSLGKAIEPLRVIFSLDLDEGGYCKLFGLRFQLDQSTPIADLLGREVRVRVRVEDSDGDVASGERLVKLSDSVL